jgi:putative protein kinase ArgK-like GTPase of G3E family
MDIQQQPQASRHNLFAYNFTHDTAPEGQPTPHVVWLTGLSAAGKSTIVDGLNPVLRARAHDLHSGWRLVAQRPVPRPRVHGSRP